MTNAHGNKCKKQKPAVICCQGNVKVKNNVQERHGE